MKVYCIDCKYYELEFGINHLCNYPENLTDRYGDYKFISPKIHDPVCIRSNPTINANWDCKWFERANWWTRLWRGRI